MINIKIETGTITADLIGIEKIIKNIMGSDFIDIKGVIRNIMGSVSTNLKTQMKCINFLRDLT